jgi:hypothetical protein
MQTMVEEGNENEDANALNASGDYQYYHSHRFQGEVCHKYATIWIGFE